MLGELSEHERWELIGQGWVQLLTPEERDLLLQWLPPSDPRVFTYAAEVAEIEKILTRATAPIGRG